MSFRNLVEAVAGLADKIDVREFPNSLGIPRAKMPQIEDKLVPEFVDWLRKRGVAVVQERVPILSLHPTQRELNADKVNGMIANAPDGVLAKIILTAADDRILDGHHRWIALVVRSPKMLIPIWRIRVPMVQLLKLAKEFPGTKYKSVAESTLAV